MYINIKTVREEYGPEEAVKRGTMTVDELINELSQYEPNTPIILSFDRGYTYGTITKDKIKENE